MSLTPDIHDWLTRPVSSDWLTQQKAAAKTHFSQFVIGDEIDDCFYMKRVCDKRKRKGKFSGEVWSIRPDFVPRHRFFGAFFCPDWFVIFTKELRDKLRTDDQWHKQIDAVCLNWDALLPHNPRHSGNQLSDYITFKTEHCDERW